MNVKRAAAVGSGGERGCSSSHVAEHSHEAAHLGSRVLVEVEGAVRWGRRLELGLHRARPTLLQP
eukprot:1485780-Prymnesium_polylepis.1